MHGARAAALGQLLSSALWDARKTYRSSAIGAVGLPRGPIVRFRGTCGLMNIGAMGVNLRKVEGEGR